MSESAFSALLGSNWLASIYPWIKHDHEQAEFLQMDEIPINYLLPGNGSTKQGYFWVSNLPGRSVLMHWHPGGDGTGLENILGETRIAQLDAEWAQLQPDARTRPLLVLQCDGYGVYDSFAKSHRWLWLAGCYAHLRRKFFDARVEDPASIAWLLRQIAALYQIEAELRHQKAGPRLREARRAAASRPIHERIKKALERKRASKLILPKSLLGRALTYAENQWEYVSRFLEDGQCEIDNNLTENKIRSLKIGTKNGLFVGAEDAGERGAILYTIVENCRLLGIRPDDYLTDVLERLPGMIQGDAWQLTPSNWQAMREGCPLCKLGQTVAETADELRHVG